MFLLALRVLRKLRKHKTIGSVFLCDKCFVCIVSVVISTCVCLLGKVWLLNALNKTLN